MSTIEKTKPNEQKVIDALAAAGEATVDEVAAAAGIGRTSSRKYLSALVDEDKARRTAGGRDGKRKLPDRFSLVSAEAEPAAGGKPEEDSRNGSVERLRPGGLDELVLAYMRGHREEGPFGPTAVAKGLGRSSGAVGNCLARLASAGEEVTQVGVQPRRYAPKEGA
jgi:hypothetical protein